MGVMSDKKMPVNLAFASRAYDDSSLLRYAYAFEKNSRLRQIPSRTPDLATGRITLSPEPKTIGSDPPRLTVDDTTETHSSNGRELCLSGAVSEDELTVLHVYVDSVEQSGVELAGSEWKVNVNIASHWEGWEEEQGTPDPKKAMIIIEASGKNGRSSAELLFL
jgi:amidase